MGTGRSIHIWKDYWLPGPSPNKVQSIKVGFGSHSIQDNDMELECGRFDFLALGGSDYSWYSFSFIPSKGSIGLAMGTLGCLHCVKYLLFVVTSS